VNAIGSPVDLAAGRRAATTARQIYRTPAIR
jgi:hypothetical protein